MTSDQFVHVALPGRTEYVVAGRVRMYTTSDGEKLCQFVYGRSYLSRREAVDLDPVQLKLTRRVRDTNGLFGVLRDSLATSWGVYADPAATAGALAFASGIEPPASTHRFNTIDELQDAPLGEHVEGVRKTVVEDCHTQWVVKFHGGTDTIWKTRVRYGALQLARDCGLHVVPNRIESIKGHDALLVQRYDRLFTGNGYACARFISGLTLLGTDDTPLARQDWSYLLLADEVRRTSSHPREDLRELFGRICFNAITANQSDDLRRPMLVARGTGWRLPPWSIPAPAVGAQGMICGPAGREPTRQNIVAGAGRFLLDRETAEAIFDRIFEIVRSSWYDVLRRSGVSVQDCELVGRSMPPHGHDR